MSNIFNINDNDLNDFINFNNVNKVIVFYKQDCALCKLQIQDLDKLANLYNSNIDFAICDIENKKKFCLNNNIITLPTTQIYKDKVLIKQYNSLQTYDELLKEINNI